MSVTSIVVGVLTAWTVSLAYLLIRESGAPFPRCADCGYDLTGQQNRDGAILGTCPECGRILDQFGVLRPDHKKPPKTIEKYANVFLVANGLFLLISIPFLLFDEIIGISVWGLVAIATTLYWVNQKP